MKIMSWKVIINNSKKVRKIKYFVQIDHNSEKRFINNHESEKLL